MQAEFPSIDPNEDLTQILPIQQKRTIAFVNHFIMNTVSHLNNFAQSCESRFMEFDYKIQKIEASLCILESQLSSIPGLDSVNRNNSVDNSVPKTDNVQINLPDISESVPEPEINTYLDVSKLLPEPEHQESTGIRAKDDPRFKKFFKMLQFGVPEPAVKLKMQTEGVDPSILENPDKLLPAEDIVGFVGNESEENSD